MKTKKLSAFALLATVTLIAMTAASTRAAEKPLRVLVFGDWGTGDKTQRSVAQAMAREADATRKSGNAFRFAVSVGDNFYERGVASVRDAQWKRKFENVYDAKRLNFPFFAVLGNHDWMGNPRAQIEYSRTPGTRWRMDNFWYRRTFFTGAKPSRGEKPLADFFFIDTDLWNLGKEKLASTQLAWLEKSLKSSRARWQIVVAHHPLFTDGMHAIDGDLPNLRAKLLPLFNRYGVDAYLCGHDHDLQRIQTPKSKTLFLISGAAGQVRRRRTRNFGPFYAAVPGFLSLSIDARKMQGKFLDAKNKTLDSFTFFPVAPQAR